MMRLEFQSSYLSINAFPVIELPDFCLITGPNGAGKSHLLQALFQGKIRADCAPHQNPNNQTEIRLFDWNTLVPQDTGMFTSEVLYNERVGAFNQYNNARHQSNSIEVLRQVIRQFGLPNDWLSEPTQALDSTEKDLAALIGPERAPLAFKALSQAESQAINSLLGQTDQQSQITFRAVAQSSKHRILALTQEDFLSDSVPSWGQVTVFQQSFARLFVAYRNLYLSNLLAQYQASKIKSDQQFLTDEDFTRVNGPPPWDFVNAALASANLDFRINHPALTEFSPYQPELTKLGSGVRIPFSALSSGEKVLMSFAFCVYYSNDRRQIAVHPKLILLDEVDAPLHPSMSKNLIGTILNTLVKSFGIKVIATTHSPSTVAIAPEDSVFTMKPGTIGLAKTSRAEALNILTVGVPTLAISFEGRRQVFVESPSDALIYDSVYKLMKPKLGSERSLEFVATGSRTKAGDTNTGCETVKRLVSELSDAGNTSVFGLIDWDGHHTSSKRLFVLAESKRNGLENIIFDPLAIALLICREFPDHKGMIGIPDNSNYISLARLDAVESLQAAVTKVCELVLSSPSEALLPVDYLGGLQLSVDARYLQTDDHALETKLLNAFPFLNSISKQQTGKLMQHIVANVYSDVQDAIPIELQNTLLHLLDAPAH